MNDKKERIKAYVVLSVSDLKRMLRTAKKLRKTAMREFKAEGHNPDMACVVFDTEVFLDECGQNQICSYALSTSGI